MIVFLNGNEVVGYIPNEDITEEEKVEILANYDNAVQTEEEFNYPDSAKRYTVRYIDGKFEYEEVEEPEQSEVPDYEARIAELEATIADMAKVISEGVNEV